jgi:uncharacterized protein
MAQFRIHTTDKDGKRVEFLYDNMTSALTHADGVPVAVTPTRRTNWQGAAAAMVVSPTHPGQKRAPAVLKIQMGLSCNYECEYCSQRFVPRAAEGNPGKVDAFIAMLGLLDTAALERIEFWGGEPFVYWKTLKPLAERLRALYPKVAFLVITNGSLLDTDKNEWLDRMGFAVSISHDGPGQCARGPDPLDDEKSRAGIMDLYARLRPQNRISINAMIHAKNPSRAALIDWMRERFGNEVPIGEGSFIDPYDEGGVSLSFDDEHDHVTFRRAALTELLNNQNMGQMLLNQQRIVEMIDSIGNGRPARVLGQKCSMDRADHLAVDMDGAMLTCQNVSRVATAPNGESHHFGHMALMGDARMRTSTHWSQRGECVKCPVLQLCKGSCMFLDGPLFETGCNSAFSDHMPYFIAAIQYLTGCAVRYIEGPQRPDRKDVLGLVMGVPPKKKVIPIKAL